MSTPAAFRAPLLAAAALTALTLAAVGGFGLRAPAPAGASLPFSFHDGFEDAAGFRALFPRDSSRWHSLQREPASNTLEPSGVRSHSGAQALKCVAAAGEGRTASKADVAREGFSVGRGDHVWFRGWFLLAGDRDASSLFLWDLESTALHNSPGRRIFIQSDGRLASDLGKWWVGKTFRPLRGAPRFPHERWVELQVHLVLSAGDGRMEVWQDGTKVIDATGRTLPTDRTRYNRLQVGITANGNRQHAHTLWVDDIAFSNRPLP